MRKTYTASFKSKVALEAIRGDRSISALASKYAVHPTQIGHWKKALLSGVSDVFSDKRPKQQQNNEKEKAQLYEEIGRLKMELNCLKKRSKPAVKDAKITPKPISTNY
jgi:transposase-like protein